MHQLRHKLVYSELYKKEEPRDDAPQVGRGNVLTHAYLSV